MDKLAALTNQSQRIGAAHLTSAIDSPAGGGRSGARTDVA